MLQNDLELIVQYPVDRGYVCRGFRQLRLARPAYVVFDGAAIGDQPTANLLGEAFCLEVLRFSGVIEETAMPCGGRIGGVSCHAMSEPTCLKLFVRPAATGSPPRAVAWPMPNAETQWLAHPKDPSWQVIPALPEGASPSTHVPSVWQGINVSFWTRHPVETIWAVLQRAGLTPEDSRLFISYVRADTTAVADQLFAALTNEGFDVFLDRCSVPIGVQFQEQLMQDLCDKAMVVLLNSAGVANSYWVGEEIAIMKTYRLGLLELRFPNVIPRPDIDPDFSQTLTASDLVNAGPDYKVGAQKLSAAMLADMVERIKEVHGRALHRRRYELIDNFAAALTAYGKIAQVLPDGTFLLRSSGRPNDTVVGLTVRPPELGDFCNLHQRGTVSAGRDGWLISPAPFFLAQRQANVSWLGGVSNIRHANEAQMSQLAATL